MNPEEIFVNAMKNVKPVKIENIKESKENKQFIVIDLHRKTLKEAISIIEYNVNRVLNEKVILKIITGKGRHSNTLKPVLAEEIKVFLKEKGLKYKEGEGFFEVW
ncbi:MAG: Smr/MutS family protein [Brevinematales bacterium]|nr:Smr/MutS family protein [Brevinematales bacterium]